MSAALRAAYNAKREEITLQIETIFDFPSFLFLRSLIFLFLSVSSNLQLLAVYVWIEKATIDFFDFLILFAVTPKTVTERAIAENYLTTVAP